jgi:hypothetical protein
MFFKPNKRYLTELTIDLGYYQKAIVIHLIANLQNVLFERIENSTGVVEQPIVIIRFVLRIIVGCALGLKRLLRKGI